MTQRRFTLWLDETPHELSVTPSAAGLSVRLLGADGEARQVRVLRELPDPLLLVDGRVVRLSLSRLGKVGESSHRGDRLSFEFDRRRTTSAAKSGSHAAEVRAPMPGRIVAVPVSVGEDVKPGQALIVIEAMKMQNELLASAGGRVAEVHVRAGDTVERGAVLLRLEAL